MGIKAGETGTCPHCKMPNRFEKSEYLNGNHAYDMDEKLIKFQNQYQSLNFCRCTNCGDNIIKYGGNLIYPLGASRSPVPIDVPKSISCDYLEACLIESYSQKAASALARRCLQNMLHERGIKDKNLNEEINIAMKNLPSHLSEAIDAIRHIGNFASHPIKFENSGEIVDVEEGEVEWVLDTLEQLFDFYYVAPRITKEKRDALNAKLTEAGKPELK